MSTPTEIVLAYTDHLQDERFVRSAVSEHGLDVLVEAVVEVLRTWQPIAAGASTVFVRDLATGLLGADLASAAQELLPASGLFGTLAMCLVAPDFNLRRQSVYTFGKLGFAENLASLEQVFRSRREIDPLLMPELLFEIFWLEQNEETLWSRVRDLAESSNDISRWAALRVVDQNFRQEAIPAVDEILSRLSVDKVAAIRAEAVYRRAECDRRIRDRGATKRRPDRRVRAEKARVGALRPKLTFADLEIAFWNAHDRADYTTAEVASFVEGRADAG